MGVENSIEALQGECRVRTGTLPQLSCLAHGLRETASDGVDVPRHLMEDARAIRKLTPSEVDECWASVNRAKYE